MAFDDDPHASGIFCVTWTTIIHAFLLPIALVGALETNRKQCSGFKPVKLSYFSDAHDSCKTVKRLTIRSVESRETSKQPPRQKLIPPNNAQEHFDEGAQMSGPGGSRSSDAALTSRSLGHPSLSFKHWGEVTTRVDAFERAITDDSRRVAQTMKAAFILKA